MKVVLEKGQALTIVLGPDSPLRLYELKVHSGAGECVLRSDRPIRLDPEPGSSFCQEDFTEIQISVAPGAENPWAKLLELKK